MPTDPRPRDEFDVRFSALMIGFVIGAAFAASILLPMVARP
jgi:hypothetical protein